MKKSINFLLPIFFGATLSFAQVTNAEGSKYTFEKVVQLDATPVQSQGNTGTCWSFSGMSFFESELMRLGVGKNIVLSEMYTVRKAYEMKAEKYIRMDGKTNFSEGGAFHDIPLVIRKYGIVPYDNYTGLEKTETYNHAEMFTELNKIMLEIMSKLGAPEGISDSWKKEYNKILDQYIGKDVKSFEFEGEKYTPKSFAEHVQLNMDNYVSLTSFTNHDMYQKCMLEIPDNWAWGESYNVSMDDLVQVTKEALKNGYTIAWGADVSEKGFSFRNGIAIVPADPKSVEVAGKDDKKYNSAGAERKSNAFTEPTTELKITPELRQEAYDNKTTTDDHGMHIVGLFTDQNGVNYFLVKNSWGTSNYPKGYLYVSENYFKYKTINIYLHKDGISKEVRSKLNL
jgi:bleomycin hydrolase